MKTLRAPLAWLLLAGVSASAQEPSPSAPPYSDTVSLTPTAGTRRSAQELEQLLAPIALYPDALLALILPASTAPTDIVLAARQVRDGGPDRTQIEHRAWDESVKSLYYYPDVLKWMDENLQWTKQLGEAFADQPVEVMQAVQRLRAQARAAGTLVDTPQQQVLSDLDLIRIVPAQPDVIYVPYYEPATAFSYWQGPYMRPFMSFGFGLPVGAWLAFECDWRRNTIWVGNRHRPWNGHDWRRPIVPIPAVASAYYHPTDVRPWRPPTPPLRTYRGLPQTAPAEHARFAPGNPPSARTYAPAAPAAPAAGVPAYQRRTFTAPTPSYVPAPAAPVTTPALAHRPSGNVPAGNPPLSPAPTTTVRRAPPERSGNPGTPANYQHRSGPPPARPAPEAVPSASASYPAPAPRASPAASPAYSRSAPPPAAASSAPAPRARPAPPPPPPAPAATAPAAPRTEGDTERNVGRRPANEQQK